MTARVERRGSWLHVYTSPYVAEYVDEMKDLPARDRAWVPDESCWRVAGDHEQAVLKLLHRHFGFAGSVENDPYRTLHLLPTAPPEVAKAAHRAMAMLCHPDHGGSHEQMQTVNAAWEQLERRLVA